MAEQDQKPSKADISGDGQVNGHTDIQSINTSSLGALQTAESRGVMDVVDGLRRTGLGGILQLPQVVVVGDQSSGKSSVLEAITEIPFPRKENLCTRFATEIILRRANTDSIATKIIPDKQLPAAERQRLEKFNSQIDDFSELPKLMEEATIAMGLGDDGSGTTRAFSRDVLSIEIAGPGRPHLTLVDLPGLIHTDNKMQTAEDIELIRGLVDDYIKEKRTIIMAVVSAKNDYANQIILKKCREVDPKGHRTLGIITKPDFLEADTENEKSWIELANNRDIYFDLGWHILKNRSEKEASKSFEQRNAAEFAFFSKGRWRDLPREMLGISSLRERLSKLLFKHLKTELPSLQKELDSRLKEVIHDLELLGEKRSTPQEQRRFLMKVSTDYVDIVKAAANGRYEHDFFGDMDPDEPLGHESNMRRTRAVVQHLNLQFATAMRRYGHASEIKDDGYDSAIGNYLPRAEAAETSSDSTETSSDSTEQLGIDEVYSRFAASQTQVAREDAVNRVRNILTRSRGRELPGTFNPLLISQLFWEQSVNWKVIAKFHVDQVALVCSHLVSAAIDFCVSEDVADRLQAFKVDTALETRLTNAKAELDRIITDAKHHPITYNPAYMETVQELRHKKQTAKLEKLMKDARVTAYNRETAADQPYLNLDLFENGMYSLVETDLDRVSAEDALDCQQAYYKEEVMYFINAVTKQVIERHLLQDLETETISPMLVGDMTDEEVTLIAAEPQDVTRERNYLEAHKATLEKGQEAFRSTLGVFK